MSLQKGLLGLFWDLLRTACWTLTRPFSNVASVFFGQSKSFVAVAWGERFGITAWAFHAAMVDCALSHGVHVSLCHLICQPSTLVREGACTIQVW